MSAAAVVDDPAPPAAAPGSPDPGVAAILSSSLPQAAGVLAQAGQENFPVALRLLGDATRRHLLALYGFARLVDDTGDEVAGDRLALLDAVEDELRAVYAGRRPAHPLMAALASTVRACGLPEEPFRRLIEANRLDQSVTRYETFEALLGYCQLSAAPVGEIVLHIFGEASPRRIALSDRVCAALQVIEHLQDVAEDAARGRIYLPAEDLARWGVEDAELGAASATPALRGVIALQAARSRDLLGAGRPLLAGLPARPRLAVAGFVAGGAATLEAIERADWDVLAHRPRRGRPAFLRTLARLLLTR